MKKLPFILILFCLPLFVPAQEYQYVPFPDSGAVWSETYSSEETSVVYERFTVNGEDTLINNLSYKKLYIFYDRVFDKSKARCVGGIREDEHRRVYFKGDSVIHPYKPFWMTAPPLDEILLYDFSCKIGDTITLNISPDESDPLTVKGIDTIKIGNSLRKIFSVGYNVKWIEGIGNLRGLLMTSESLPTGGGHGDLICFLQNDTILYHIDQEYYTDCFPFAAGVSNSKLKDFDVTVCPNPVTGNSIRFEWNNNTLKTLELFNFNGALIESIKVAGQNQLEYPAESFQPGLYFYRAKGSEGNVQTGKFEVK